MQPLNPYPEYKDSGVPWLGQVPEHWAVARNKLLMRERNDHSLDGSEELLTVSQYTGVSRRRDRLSGDSGLLTNATSLVGYKRVAPGDLVMNIMLAWNGSLGISAFDGIVSPAYCVFRLVADLEPRYLHYLLRTPLFTGAFKQASTGVVDSRLRLYPDVFFSLSSLLPPRSEQAAVALFLDFADRRIRRYIRAKQKLVQLLEEQQQKIVQHAVTRGLDPTVQFRPTRVKWLGDVPEHWEVRKLRYCGAMSGGMTPSMEVRRYWGGEVPWVTPKDMKRASIADSSVRVSDAAIEETGLRPIPRSSVLVVVRGMILARKVPVAWTMAPVTINQDMKAISPHGGIVAQFLACSLRSAQAQLTSLIDQAGHGTRRLPTDRLRDIAVALPPKDEQVAITKFIEQEAARFDVSIEAALRQIALVREYGTRLVTDVVTGQVDIREAATRLPKTVDGDSGEFLEPLEQEPVDAEPDAEEVEV